MDIGKCLPRQPNHNLAIATVVVANFVFRSSEMDGKLNEQNVCPNSEDKKPENGSSPERTWFVVMEMVLVSFLMFL